MGTGNGAQILEVLSGSDLHTQGIAIRLFFERAWFFARRVSAFACFPCHCYLQPNLLILLPYFRNVITLPSRWQAQFDARTSLQGLPQESRLWDPLSSFVPETSTGDRFNTKSQ